MALAHHQLRHSTTKQLIITKLNEGWNGAQKGLLSVQTTASVKRSTNCQLFITGQSGFDYIMLHTVKIVL